MIQIDVVGGGDGRVTERSMSNVELIEALNKCVEVAYPPYKHLVREISDRLVSPEGEALSVPKEIIEKCLYTRLTNDPIQRQQWDREYDEAMDKARSLFVGKWGYP